MSSHSGFSALFRRDLIRLAQEIAAFWEEAWLWKTIPGVTNCAGNLTLHLEGNLREYIGRQLGGIEYLRRRSEEFTHGAIPAEELIARVEQLRDMIPGILDDLAPSAMSAPYPEIVLDEQLSTHDFIVHLHGHFNYHLGQIDYLRRALTGDAALPLGASVALRPGEACLAPTRKLSQQSAGCGAGIPACCVEIHLDTY